MRGKLPRLSFAILTIYMRNKLKKYAQRGAKIMARKVKIFACASRAQDNNNFPPLDKF